MSQSRVDFGKTERDMSLIMATKIAQMQCTCGDPDCEVQEDQMILALLFATQAMAVVQTRQASVDLKSTFREVFG